MRCTAQSVIIKMFGFLKEKLKSAISSFTKKVDKEAKEQISSEVNVVEEQSKEKPILKKKKQDKVKKSKQEKPVIQEEIVEEQIPRVAEIVEQLESVTPEKKGFFSKLKEKIVSKKLDEKQFDDLFWDLELVLLENNVAVEVIEKIKQDLKTNLVDQPIKRNQIEQTILNSLKNSIDQVLNISPIDLIKEIKDSKKPYIICFFGVNGSGKTTTIAKLAQLFKRYNISIVLAAADTFRAAAIQQLEEHANILAVKMIKHDYGSDSAAVAFDAVKYAEAHNIDVVLIDTAGRMHSNTNLMDELKKIVKVIKPNLNIFIGESITGNDCIEQAKIYDEQIGIQAIILTKADIDDKGGAPISISYVTKKPIIYLATGQNYDDLKPFDKNEIIQKLF